MGALVARRCLERAKRLTTSGEVQVVVGLRVCNAMGCNVECGIRSARQSERRALEGWPNRVGWRLEVLGAWVGGVEGRGCVFGERDVSMRWVCRAGV